VNAKDVKVASYLFFHSDLDLKETYAICEVVLNIHDKTNNLNLINTVSMGLLPIKITDEAGKAAAGDLGPVNILLTTPRIFMLFDTNQTVKSKIDKVKPAPNKVNVKVVSVNLPPNRKQLYQLVQSNCLIGP
jgi:hypothetical protein